MQFVRAALGLREVAVVLAFGLMAAAPCAANSVPNIGEAGEFAVFGLANAYVSDSHVTINGNEGIAEGGTVYVRDEQPVTVTGNAVEYTSGQFQGDTSGTIDGSIVVNSTLVTTANTDATNAYNTAAADKPTQTLGNITASTTIKGDGGLNVINISSVNLSGTDAITLTGKASDIFVVQVSGNFILDGSASFLVGGSVTPEHVLIVFTGSGQEISIQDGSTTDGTLLAPDPNTNWAQSSGIYNGEIITGASSESEGLSLTSGATVNFMPFSGVPEPGSLLLAGLGAVGLLAYTRYRPRPRG